MRSSKQTVKPKKRVRNARQKALMRARIKYSALGLLGLTCMLSIIWVLQKRYPQQAWAFICQRTLEKTEHLGLVANRISVIGAQRTSKKEVIQASTLYAGRRLMSLDLTHVQKEIEQLPWVKQAVVMRSLPDKVSIAIQEREPIALWQHRKKHYLVDEKGEVITNHNIEDFVHLPVVVGGKAAYKAPEILGIIQDFPLVLEVAKSFVYIQERRWDLHLVNGIVVKLPSQKLSEALERLTEFLNSPAFEEDDIKVIDVRLTDRTVLQLAGGSKFLAKVKGKAT